MNQMAKPVTHHEALIYAMVTLSAADRAMTDKELMKIGDIVRTMPIFADFDPDRLIAIATACGALLRDEDGLDKMLGIIKTALPPRLYETLYACAVEVAAAAERLRIPVVGELDLGFVVARGREEYQRETPTFVDVAAELLQAELVAVEVERLLEVGHSDHGVQVLHCLLRRGLDRCVAGFGERGNTTHPGGCGDRPHDPATLQSCRVRYI